MVKVRKNGKLVDLKKLGEYKNGTYSVCIFSDGSKVRYTEGDEFIPEFPECLDVKITSKCSVGCPYCYENCTRSGKHAELLKWKFWDSVRPYTEIAINGNDMDHPQLAEFLEMLKSRNVIANITVEESQFIRNIDIISDLDSAGLIHGIGISYKGDAALKDILECVYRVSNPVFHTVNGICTVPEYDMLSRSGIPILILGYKVLGRGANYINARRANIIENQDALYEELGRISGNKSIISMDNLAIRQLNPRRLYSTDEEYEEYYMGDDGEYTFYLDLVDGKFALNSISSERFEIGDCTIDEMFAVVKNAKEGCNA